MAAGSIRIARNVTAPRLCHLMLRRIEFFHPVAVFQNLARLGAVGGADDAIFFHEVDQARGPAVDRKSTRLNSSHGYISYAVFCLKKKKTANHHMTCVHRIVSASCYRYII